MKNKWNAAKTFIKEEVRPETFSAVMTIAAFSFGIGVWAASSAWATLFLIVPFVLGVVTITMLNQIVKLDTMHKESGKRIKLIQEYNELLDRIMKVRKNESI